MEREARFDSYAVALCEYLLYFSALANCKNIGGLMILAHLTDAVCSEELRFLRKSFQKPPKIISKLSFEHLRRVSETSGKIIPKSFQNPSKNLPKSYPKGGPTRSPKKNRVLLFLLRLLGASWAVWEASWRVLGVSWGRLGPSWGVLGASWRVLGASWEPLGASWAACVVLVVLLMDF